MNPALEGSVIRVVVDHAVQERLDSWLASRLADQSRTQVARLIQEGRVLVNGKPPRKRDQPAAGDVIEIDIPPPAPSTLEPEAIPLNIVFEDAQLLVIDKPAGLVVHPSPGHASGTLVNALLHHVGDLSGIGGVRRPGLVHRLDRNTSGLMIVAKSDVAHRRLSAALKRREIRRTYTAVTWGHLRQDEQAIDAPIGRSPSDRRRMAVVAGGRPAITHVRRLERWVAADLLDVRLETGRTHQIRVHLASIGHPVVGDLEYGAAADRGMSGSVRGWARELARRTPRQFLHATGLAFVHPTEHRMLEFASPLPPDLEAAAAWARASSGAA